MVSSPPRRHDVSSTAGWLSPRSPAPAEVGSAGLAVASATGRLSPRSPAADRRSLRAYVFGAEVAKPAQSPAQRQRPKPISPGPRSPRTAAQHATALRRKFQGQGRAQQQSVRGAVLRDNFERQRRLFWESSPLAADAAAPRAQMAESPEALREKIAALEAQLHRQAQLLAVHGIVDAEMAEMAETAHGVDDETLPQATTDSETMVSEDGVVSNEYMAFQPLGKSGASLVDNDSTRKDATPSAGPVGHTGHSPNQPPNQGAVPVPNENMQHETAGAPEPSADEKLLGLPPGPAPAGLPAGTPAAGAPPASSPPASAPPAGGPPAGGPPKGKGQGGSKGNAVGPAAGAPPAGGPPKGKGQGGSKGNAGGPAAGAPPAGGPPAGGPPKGNKGQVGGAVKGKGGSKGNAGPPPGGPPKGGAVKGKGGSKGNAGPPPGGPPKGGAVKGKGGSNGNAGPPPGGPPPGRPS